MSSNNINQINTLESKLSKFVEKINIEVGDKTDGGIINSNCSIFLYDFKRDRYVLRAATNATPYLSKTELNTSLESKEKYESTGGPYENVGLTVTSIYEMEPIIYDSIGDNPFSSTYQYTEDELFKWEESNYCEYKRDDIKSILLYPIIFKDGDEPSGIIRVVRNIKHNDNFSDNDIEVIKQIVDKNIFWIESGTFLSELIELGTYMDLPNLCSRASHVLKNVIDGKGCSIFLLDEKDSDNNQKTYKCYGTTGLIERKKRAMRPITDPLNNKKAWYSYKIDKENSKPELPLTLGVIRARMCAFIDDISDQNEIDEQFPLNLKIIRKSGPGKISEGFIENDIYQQTKSVLYAPMFYDDPNNENLDVLGVVRVAKAESKDPFTIEQKHLFVSIVEQLSKAVTNGLLLNFMDSLSNIKNYEELFHAVVKNVPKFISGTDCALLLCENNSLKKCIEWKDGVITTKGNFIEDYKYDLLNSEQWGYSGFIAARQQSLMFNSIEELERQFANKKFKPIHHPDSNSNPHRFLGVPIISNNKTIAVLRICKDEKTTRFTPEDLQMLERISNHLSIRIENYVKEKKRELEITSIFSNELLQKSNQLNNITSREIIHKFIKQIKNYNNMEDAILDFIPKLWELYKPSFGDQPIQILNDFEFFNNKILSEIPHYRDHFIHQFIVLLTGIIILDNLKIEFKKLFPKYYPQETFNKNSNIIDEKVESAWILTALFHDVTYPLEKIDNWFSAIIKKFLRDDIDYKNNINLMNILFNSSYIDKIDILSSYLSDSLYEKPQNIRNSILEILNTPKGYFLDHGIMGALLLLNNSRFETEHILPIASAISLHNKLSESYIVNKIDFERHPLAFLLIYCDLLHEWSREIDNKTKLIKTKESPILERIEIVNSWKEFKDLGIDNSKILKLIPDIQDDKKCVYSHIVLNNKETSEYKEKEIKEYFLKLESKNVYWFIQLNGVLYSVNL